MTKKDPLDKPSILIGIPNYSNQLPTSLTFELATMMQPSFPFIIEVKTASSSVLTHTFNVLWAHMLNNRSRFTHFLMLHDDIVPEGRWLEHMIYNMAAAKVDVLSAVVPMKDDTAFVSTALDKGTNDCYKLTVQECRDMGPLIEHKDLLINTGLMLVDLRASWIDQVVFTFVNDILLMGDGLWKATCLGEDYKFSRDVKRLGGSLAATTGVTLKHIGTKEY